MGKAFKKIIRRGFNQSFTRLIAVTSIIFLTTGFVLGLMTTPQAMQKSMDSHYDGQNMFDISIKSSAGITGDDVGLVGQHALTASVMPFYSTDALISVGERKDMTARVYGLPLDELSGEGFISRPQLIEGRMPQSNAECVAERSGNYLEPIAIGSQITVSKALGAADTALKVREYTVVGIVGSPLYYDKTAAETAGIGSGVLSAAVYAFESCFDMNSGGAVMYTDMFVTVQGAADMDSFSAVYREEMRDAAAEMSAALTAADAEKPLFKDRAWYVSTREHTLSYSNFYQNTDKVRAIVNIFPVFFLFVAALVVLSTMSRMVEEDRLKIGTLKSLGYKKSVILSQYLIYSLFAAVLGSALGVAAGFTVIPNVVYYVFSATYYLPPLSTGFGWLSTTLIVLTVTAVTAGVTVNTVLKTLRQTTSALLLPRAPKPGKRILLERIPFIWKRLSFKYKSTMRNVFRQKKHFIMTITGVAGCTALMLAGFGIYDSVDALTEIQYREIVHYDISINLQSDSYDDVLNEYLHSQEVQGSFFLYGGYHAVKVGDKSAETMLYAANPNGNLSDYVNLRERSSGRAIAFDEHSVIMSEMLAKELGLREGGAFTAAVGTQDIKLVLSGIAENYLGSFIYVSDTLIPSIGAGVWNNTLLVKANLGQNTTDEIAANLMESTAVSGIRFTENIVHNYKNLLASIVSVVVLLIVTAGALSLIVLYNLTNISISERKNEISTLKVLGYYDNEIAGFVLREIFIMTLIGIVIGLLLGVFLHLYIVVQIDSAMLMLGRTVKWTSYIYSLGFTLLFSVIIDLIMYPKLKKVNMIESMKAN